MTQRWIDYLKRNVDSRNLLDFAVEYWVYNMPLYQRIKKYIQPPQRILEVGCGYGLSAVYLRECGFHVTAIDNDPNIVQMAMEAIQHFRSDVGIECANAFDLSRYHASFELVFSTGVIEHFEREGTVQLLREQAKCASYVVGVIPSKYTKFAGKITDERIYTMRGLQKIFEDAQLRVLETFGYGDIPSRWHILIKRLLPYGAYRLLQNRYGYCMSMGAIGATDTNSWF